MPGRPEESPAPRDRRDSYGFWTSRTANPDGHAGSCSTVNPAAALKDDGGSGKALKRTFTSIVLPWIWIPAVGVESIETRQKSFGGVAPPVTVAVCACHASGF